MCAIIDANVVGEVFGKDRPEAGEKFFRWLNGGKGILVTGGRLSGELSQSRQYREWARQARLAGKLKEEDEGSVGKREAAIRGEGTCESDDPHILALAQVSGARLLYTNDRALQSDFRKRDLIAGPRGKVYSTHGRRDYTSTHRKLLSNKSLCRSR